MEVSKEKKLHSACEMLKVFMSGLLNALIVLPMLKLVLIMYNTSYGHQ